MTDKSISKQQSLRLHGIAVIMMLFHHFFAAPQNLTLLHFFNADLCLKLSWLCKLCVAMFAFLSGYGMNFGCDSRSVPEYGKLYKKAGLRIAKLYGMLAVVIILLRVIPDIINHVIISPYELVMNALGILYTYNGSWWYVFFYVLLCLGFPVVRFYLTRCIPVWRKVVVTVIIVALVGIFYVAAQHLFFPYLMIVFMYLQVALHPSILLAFFAGIFVSEFRIFDCMCSFVKRYEDKNRAVGFLMRYMIPVLAIAVCCAVRIVLADSAAYSTSDFVLVPIIIAAYVLITMDREHGRFNVFAITGKYSTGMWLVHVLVMGITYEMVARGTRFVPLFFVAEVILSYISSVIVTNIESCIIKLIQKKANTEKRVQKIELS